MPLAEKKKMKIFQIIAGIFIAVIVVGVLIVGYDFYRRFKRRISQKDIGEIQDAWKAIIREPDMRHAIMEADKLLDLALGKMGFRGNLGNKLKKAHRLFGAHINRIWSAHKVRNNIAHQMHYKVDEKLFRATMLAFKEAFKSLRIF